MTKPLAAELLILCLYFPLSDFLALGNHRSRLVVTIHRFFVSKDVKDNGELGSINGRGFSPVFRENQ